MTGTYNSTESAKARMMEAIRQRQALATKKMENAEISKQQLMAHIPLAAASVGLSVGSTAAVTTQSGIVLNEQQLLAVEYGRQLRSFCLIGAAGTGKTTSSKELILAAIETLTRQHGELPKGAISIVSFTRRAVKNISKAVKSIGADKFCETIHSYLKYAPNRDGYVNDKGEFVKTMRFEPTITAMNPNKDCRLMIVEESSMVGYTSLWKELREASPNAAFVFIGDLNQLPPVFGDAVLGFKLAELPVVELTQVYRQAMESPIIWFQHNFTLKGAIPTETVLKKLTAECTDATGCEFIPFKQNHNDGEVMSEGVAHYMMRQLEAGLYDPLQDTILIPFNKSFGSIAINLHIAEYLAKREKLEVFEIFASYDKKYFAVSDFVMYEKRECRILRIEHNKKYLGQSPQPESVDLSRYGYIRIGGKAPMIDLDAKISLDDISANALLDMAGSKEDDDDKTTAASHIITLQDCDTLAEFEISKAGEVRSLDFGYCMTIHKAQGSEWRKVWLILHRMHATMLSREILYTGMTRAREKISILYSGPTASGRTDSSISKACQKAVIPGTGWKSKVEYFKGKKQTSGAAGGWHG